MMDKPARTTYSSSVMPLDKSILEPHWWRSSLGALPGALVVTFSLPLFIARENIVWVFEHTMPIAG